MSSHGQPGNHKGLPPHSPAFTLIELLAIMAIVVILLSIGAAGSVHWGRAARMRGSAREVTSSAQFARQWAMTRRSRTRLFFANDIAPPRGYYVVSTPDHGIIGTTNFLARGIVWTNNMAPVEFRLDGTCDAPDRDIVMTEAQNRANRLVTTVTVYSVTGYATVQD